MTNTPNLYGFATKELAQDATIAYILAWADPLYKDSHPRLLGLGTELLRSLLATQNVGLPPIAVGALCIQTQVDRIDILVRINTEKNGSGIILIIEDKVSTQEHSNQIDRYKDIANEKFVRESDRLVAVYLKTGNESQESLPPEDQCGRFLRPQLLAVMDRFKDTNNDIIENFRDHLQEWEDETNRWKALPYYNWQWCQWEGFYAALEERWWERHKDWCGWGHVTYRGQGFLGWWGCAKKFETLDGCSDLYLQIHNATRLTIRLGSGNEVDRVDAPFMYQVFRSLESVAEKTSGDFQLRAGRFRGGSTAAVANEVTFGEQCTWLAVYAKGIVDLDACVERLQQVRNLIEKVAAQPTTGGSFDS